MNVGYFAPVSMIQSAKKWSKTVAQYRACAANRRKDAELCLRKGSLNIDDTNGSSQDDLQDTLFYSLPFTLVEKKNSPDNFFVFGVEVAD